MEPISLSSSMHASNVRDCDCPHSISMNCEGATRHADTVRLFGDINLGFLSTKVAVKALEVIIAVSHGCVDEKLFPLPSTFCVYSSKYSLS